MKSNANLHDKFRGGEGWTCLEQPGGKSRANLCRGFQTDCLCKRHEAQGQDRRSIGVIRSGRLSEIDRVVGIYTFLQLPDLGLFP